MTVDILFLAKNRLEFTRQALAALLANTNWDLVRFILLLDDGSEDGTEDLFLGTRWPVSSLCMAHSGLRIGSPAGWMNWYLKQSPSDVFAKLDNDVIVPPGWLDACAAVMEAHPELDLLGIEPPASRTPHREGGPCKPAPEYRVACEMNPDGELGYAPCDSIGGIGLMRTQCFRDNGPLKPHSIYGGFTEWQLAHSKIRKGWIVPPLKVFLLDRMPHEPWASLSKQYEAAGWQRAWSKYPESAKDALWGWWKPVGRFKPEPIVDVVDEASDREEGRWGNPS